MEGELEIKAFIEYIENYIPIQKRKAKRWPSSVPALVIPEFTEEDWEYLRTTGDWKSLKATADKAIAESSITDEGLKVAKAFGYTK